MSGGRRWFLVHRRKFPHKESSNRTAQCTLSPPPTATHTYRRHPCTRCPSGTRPGRCPPPLWAGRPARQPRRWRAGASAACRPRAGSPPAASAAAFGDGPLRRLAARATRAERGDGEGVVRVIWRGGVRESGGAKREKKNIETNVGEPQNTKQTTTSRGGCILKALRDCIVLRGWGGAIYCSHPQATHITLTTDNIDP